MAVIFFVWALPATIGQDLANEWQLSATALGFLGSFLFYLYALMQIPSGYLSDTWGPRRTVTTALLVMALGQVIFSLATGLELALLGRGITGIGTSLILIAVLKILVNWFRTREFATLVGITTLVGFAGAILATAPLAFVVLQWGWRPPLLAVGLITFVLALLNWVLVRDDPRELGLPPISELDPGALVPVTRKISEVKGLKLVRRAFQTWRSTVPAWGFSFIVFLGYGSVQAFQFLWAGSYLINVHQMSLVEAGNSLWLLSLGGGLSPLLSGYLSDKVVRARRPFLIAGTLGVSVGWLAILVTTGGASIAFIDATFLLLGFSGGLILIGQAMVKEAVTSEMFGTVFGIANMFPFLGNALFQLLIGLILTATAATASDGTQIYTANAYLFAFLPALVASIGAVVLALFVPETLKRALAAAMSVAEKV